MPYCKAFEAETKNLLSWPYFLRSGNNYIRQMETSRNVTDLPVSDVLSSFRYVFLYLYDSFNLVATFLSTTIYDCPLI